MSLVIINAFGQFWNGTVWVNEYPDACRYSDLPVKAVLAACSGWVQVVSNYGEVNERARLRRG